MNNQLLRLKRVLGLCTMLFFLGQVQGQGILDSLPPVDSLSDSEVTELFQQLAAEARHLKSRAKDLGDVALENKYQAEKTYTLAKEDSTTLKAALDSLSGILKHCSRESKKADELTAKISKLQASTVKIADESSEKQRKSLKKCWTELRQIKKALQPKQNPEEAVKEKEPKKKEEKKPRFKKERSETARDTSAIVPAPVSVELPKQSNNVLRQGKKYDPQLDVMLNPPPIPCQFHINVRDEFSGEPHRQVVSLELFRYAPPALRNFLKGKPNVLCEAALSAKGAKAYLNLTFIIHDPSPKRAFGKLDQNSQAVLTFMDGSVFTLYNLQLNEGQLNEEDQSYVFQSEYAVNEELIKKIKKSELDKLRIFWSSGYEDYDVQFVHLLMQQARCLFE
jgi:hypothetical protein